MIACDVELWFSCTLFTTCCSNDGRKCLKFEVSCPIPCCQVFHDFSTLRAPPAAPRFSWVSLTLLSRERNHQPRAQPTHVKLWFSRVPLPGPLQLRALGGIYGIEHAVIRRRVFPRRKLPRRARMIIEKRIWEWSRWKEIFLNKIRGPDDGAIEPCPLGEGGNPGALWSWQSTYSPLFFFNKTFTRK